ncbi:MAG: hypothetical protein ACU0GG_04015 [Paracoccaceae bacterium]
MSNALQTALAERNLGRVIDIYTDAANDKEEAGDIDAACFLLTHAWVHALEAGDDRATDIRARLIAHGRERDG